MSYLKLWFNSGVGPQLERSEFYSSKDNKKHISVRGKDSGAFIGAGSFIWSAGVRAVCIFFLKSCYHHNQSNIFNVFPPVMRGERSTPSHSLALSVAKGPNWMHEMFGSDISGNSYLRRIIKASNLYFKLGSIVSLGLNTNILPYSNIEIYLDNEQITCSEQFKELIISLGGRISKDIEMREEECSCELCYEAA